MSNFATGSSRRALKPWAGLVAALGLAFAGSASAVPCSPLVLSGGILPSISCQDGPAGDSSPSAGDLNSGNYFGSTSWSMLDSTSDGVNSSIWSFSEGPNGERHGAFSLASGLWSGFSKLAVVLNGRGGVFDGDIKWSAYLLPNGYEGVYLWTYDYVHRLTNASIYGVGRQTPGTVTVPEPATLAVLVLGLAAGTLVLRRKKARAVR